MNFIFYLKKNNTLFLLLLFAFNFSNAQSNFGNPPATPTITSFTPASGPTGTTITITGTSFLGTSGITIGGTAVSSFTVDNDTSITAVVPAATSGTVEVTTPYGVATSTTNFAIDPTIVTTGTSEITFIGSCSNTSSVPKTFTVGGFNLTANLTITSDDTSNIEFSTNNSTYSSSLTLATTNGEVATTTVYIRIKLSASTMSAATKIVTITSGTESLSFQFIARREQLTPTISLFSGILSNIGSNVITIPYSYTNRTPVLFSVSAGSPALNGFTPIVDASLQPDKLTIPIPINSSLGNYNFNITVNNGCTSSVYNIPVTITEIPPSISTIVPISANTGSSVILTGSGFSTILGENKLYLSGIPCAITNATTSSLTFNVPAGTSTGKLYYTNTNSGLTTVSGEDFIPKFSYPPGISNFLPGNYLLSGSSSIIFNSSSDRNNLFSFADFNADQKPDVVVFSTQSIYNKLSYITNATTSSGSFVTTTNMPITTLYSGANGGAGYAKRAVLGDYDGDGDIDIYGPQPGNTGSTWLKNTSTGGAISVTSLGDVANSVNNYGASIIDIERDGKIDVVGLYSSSLYDFKNTTTSPSSTFSFSLISKSTSSALDATAITGDVDKDGYQDVIFKYSSGIRIRPNSGGWILSETNDILIPTAISPWDYRLADLDLDGKNDLLVTIGANLTVLRNLSSVGSIAFDSQLNFVTGNGNTTNYGICVVDVNNDGLPDVLVSGNAKLVLFINNSSLGNISFLTPQNLGSASGLFTVNAIDLNGDGYMDIVGSDNTNLEYFIFSYIPTITSTGTSNITELAACLNSPSAAQSFIVSGENLTANLTVSSNDSTNIEFSTDGTSYSNSIILTPSSGTVAATTVYIRQKSSVNAVASASKTVTIASTGATSVTFSFTRVVNNTTISTQPSVSTRTYCQNTTPIDLSVIATGLGLTYQWYSNTVNTSTTGATLINGATSSTYSPTTSTISALYYYCIVTGTCSTVTSNFSGKITITAPSVGGAATATSSSICTNTATTILLSGNTGTIQWQQSTDGSTGWANVIGGSGATSATYTTPALTTTNYYRAVVTKSGCNSDYSTTALVAVSPTSVAGTPAASSNPVCSGSTTDLTLTNYIGNIQWQSSTNNSTWNNINGATAANYTTPAISATSYYKAVVTSGACAVSSSATITINLNTDLTITTQPAATTQNICQNGTATALSVIATGSGLTYQWYSNSTSSTTGSTLIPNATAAAFIPDTTSVTALYYYCEVTGACSSLTSSISGLVTINSSSVAGTPTVSSNSICAGSTTDLTLTGYTGTIQWQSSANNSTWNNINGANSDTYTTASLSSTTYYKANVTNSSCTAANSSTITVTVNPLPSISLTSILYTATYNVNSQNVSINYTASTGNPTNYNISWINNPNNNLSPVTNASLTSSPLTISIPGGANLGMYSGILTVENTDLCTSANNTFSINITNGDTTPPIITYPLSQNNNGNYSYKMSENTAAVTTYTANETVTWSITGGSEQNLFSIDSNTGALSFINPPFYGNPTDSAPTNSYIVEITATDSNGNYSKQTVTVTISPFCGSWGN
jgi:hypothetical protein